MEIGITLQEIADLIGVTRSAVSQSIGQRKGASRTELVVPSFVREFLEGRGFRYNKQRIAFQVVKGGVGKTSLAKNFAIRASQFGFRTLLIDFDHQCNLSVAVGQFDPDAPSWYDFVSQRTGTYQIHDLVRPICDSLAIIPSNLNNTFLDKEMIVRGSNIASCIERPLVELNEKWDLIICDCPPAINNLTNAIYLGVDKVIAPAKPDIFSKMGLELVFNKWNELNDEHGKAPEIKILINQFDPRSKRMTEYLQDFFALYSQFMFPSFIRSAVDFVTNMEADLHLWSDRKKSQAADELDLIVKQVTGLFEHFNADVKGKTTRNQEVTE